MHSEDVKWEHLVGNEESKYCLQDALQEGVMIRAQHLMSSAFTTWLDNVREIQDGKERLLQFVDRSALRHMRHALCAWRELTEERLARKAQLQKCIR